jgi:hypothetical protein
MLRMRMESSTAASPWLTSSFASGVVVVFAAGFVLDTAWEFGRQFCLFTRCRTPSELPEIRFYLANFPLDETIPGERARDVILERGSGVRGARSREFPVFGTGLIWMVPTSYAETPSQKNGIRGRSAPTSIQ